jgi:hypothetical protein
MIPAAVRSFNADCHMGAYIGFSALTTRISYTHFAP